MHDAGCFFDSLTKRWRYEYGEPATVAGRLLLGTNIWIEVRRLFSVLLCTSQRLTGEQRTIYLARLANPRIHHDTLVEFVPVMRLPDHLNVRYEVATGSGNRNVDWLIDVASGRKVLLDVKRRSADLYAMGADVLAGKRGPDGQAPMPDHDPSLLFRSVQEKFLRANSGCQLQGAWIITDLAQEKHELEVAFAALDAERVHFAVLNNWGPGAKVLAREDADVDFLKELFSVTAVGRFEFERG
jgi:hypothetical protein